MKLSFFIAIYNNQFIKMPQNHKQNLGQFFTTNSDYILKGFEPFIKNKNVTDPFAGNQDLLNWAKKNNCKNAIGFDIDQNFIEKKGSFLFYKVSFFFYFFCFLLLARFTRNRKLIINSNFRNLWLTK